MNKRIMKKKKKILYKQFQELLSDPKMPFNQTGNTLIWGQDGRIANWDKLNKDTQEDFLENMFENKDYSHRKETYPAIEDMKHRLHTKEITESDMHEYFKLK